jgi:predicted Rossmann fold flavoprotein
MERAEVVILGAGAAGMMCAIEAGRRGRRVLLIDHASAPGEKIRISGGGRCNFTNLGTSSAQFLSGNPRFAISALKRFSQWDFIARVDAVGIAWHEKTLGQLFCDGSAKEIIAMLRRDMERAGVTLWLGCEIGGVGREGAEFVVKTVRGDVRAGSMVVATGGKSIPKMGATGFGYKLAEMFGLRVRETRPGLVPLTLAGQELDRMAGLAGVAVEARVTAGAAVFDEAILFTHRGLSGPAVLQASSYWREGEAIRIDLARGKDVRAVLREARGNEGKIAVRTALGRVMPERLARFVEAEAGVLGTMADQSNAAIERIVGQVQDWTLRPVGSEGYRTAEVTLGGVDTDDLDARTMEAKAVPGLYFIGEVVDVTGWLGGYNFQWAWSSGWVAGQVV